MTAATTAETHVAAATTRGRPGSITRTRSYSARLMALQAMVVGTAVFTSPREVVGLAIIVSVVAIDYLSQVAARSSVEAVLVALGWSGAFIALDLARLIAGDADLYLYLGAAALAYLGVPLAVALVLAVLGDRGLGSTASGSAGADDGDFGSGSKFVGNTGGGRRDMVDTHTNELGYGEASGPTARPANFVAGVIHDRDQFDRALHALRASGIDERSFGILYGARGADAIAHRPRRWLSELLGDENRYVERYENEIRDGGLVVGIALDRGHEDDRETVRQILRAHGARFIVSRTPWTHTIED